MSQATCHCGLPPILTIPEVTDHLRLSEKSVRRLITAGEISTLPRAPGTAIRVARSANRHALGCDCGLPDTPPPPPSKPSRTRSGARSRRVPTWDKQAQSRSQK